MEILNDRLETLALIKETLTSEVKFYLSRKDWPKVTARKQALRACAEQIAKVRHLKIAA